MKKTLLKSLILFLSIPLLNSLGFAFGTLFHDLFHSSISGLEYARYQNVMVIMILICGISILLIERIYDTEKFNNQMAVITYSAVFILIGVLTWDQFIFRPYEHTLTIFSILSILGTREFLNRTIFKLKNRSENAMY